MGREWQREVERERAVLEHILALLLSLAALADRAVGAPDHVRLYVLDTIGHGEAAARALLIGMAEGRVGYGARVDFGGAQPQEHFRPADDPALLAATLRVLALAVFVMLARGKPHGGDALASGGWSARLDPAAPTAGLPAHAARGPPLRGTGPSRATIAARSAP